MMVFRKATQADIPAVAAIYASAHTAQERGLISTGWVRAIYPTEETARMALARGDLFVGEDDGRVFGTAIINQTQVDVYADGHWKHPAADEQVMVLHTLVIDQALGRHGYGRAFVGFYEAYAREHDCPYLRMDTNAINVNARGMYKKLGYDEVDIVPCVFNGIPDVQLVLLEKKLEGQL